MPNQPAEYDPARFLAHAASNQDKAQAIIMHAMMYPAPDAIPNGTRIIKSESETGDLCEIGTTGTVVGSIASEVTIRGRTIKHAYIIHWDGTPDWAFIFTTDFKIKPATIDAE